MLAFDDVESADAGGNVNADFIQIGLIRRPLRGFDREVRAREGDLDESPHFFEFFFLDPPEGIEILHFTGDGAVETGGVKKRNRPYAALTGKEIFTAFVRADSQRADEPNARNDDPASQLLLPGEVVVLRGCLLSLGVLIDVFDRVL